MKHPGTNLLVSGLVEACKTHLFEEKWLVAPSRNVGYQWLDTATRAGARLLNVRVKTLASLAMDLAAPEMARLGVELIIGVRSELLVDQLFREQKQVRGGYLHNIEDSPGLTSALHRTIADLRIAGLSAGSITQDAFEVATKGIEIKRLLESYEASLHERNLVDRADVLRLATESLKNDPSSLPEGTVVLIPAHLASEMTGLERAVWEAIPAGRKIVLDEDSPGGAWDNDTARLFSAVGEVNEVREVLRRCVSGQIPFDDVEIVCTDPDTYIPLIYEISARVDSAGGVPATFAGGIPVRYSRPARALIAWVSWVREGFPQTTMVRMIQDGLLKIDLPKDVKFGFTRLGQILREVPIGYGADLYVSALESAMADIKERYEWKKPALAALRILVEQILPDKKQLESPLDALGAASVFLKTKARLTSQFDGHSRERLTNQIDELATSLKGVDNVEGLDPWLWLAELARSAKAGGSGPRSSPRPGCLHVSSLMGGGHTGRGHTFILGLDDTRFPGGGMQDPLLLDAERVALSEDLVTSGQRLARKIESMSLLLARLRGEVGLSYCARSLSDDRSLFPGSAFMAAYRILSGNRDGDHESLRDWLPNPVAFAPLSPDDAVDSSEWWLSQTCGERKLKSPSSVINASFPHLGHGQIAIEARESGRFTEYDGYVPEAGEECDPFVKDARALSASRLENLGTCPLDYFFQHVLRISTPEEYCPDPTVWLDALMRGSLLHDVFREFMYRLRQDDLLPDYKRDLPLLLEVVKKEVAALRAESPPPSEEVFASQVKEVEQIARIFLIEEERYCKGSIPRYFEVAIGLKPDREGSPLDTHDNVDISLPGGKSIRAHGRIDRVDEVAGSGGKRFSLWDYKTGSAWKYHQGDKVHQQGRVIQNILYVELVRKQLKKLHPGAAIQSFGYFFPSLREHGERISWKAAELEQGKQKIAWLCELLATGCFPDTDSPGDLKYSDYKPAHGDVDASASAMSRKLANPENVMLSPYAQLRGFDWGDGDE